MIEERSQPRQAQDDPRAVLQALDIRTRLYLHGNLPGLLTLAAEESTRLVAGAGFWRLLILLDEPVVEVRRGAGGVVVADANVVAATAL